MKIKKQPRNIYIIISIAVLMVLSLVSLSILLNNKKSATPVTDDPSTNTVDYAPATKSQQDAGKDQKQQTIDSTKSSDTQNTTTNQSIGVIITSAIQNDKTNTLNIRSLIDTVTNNGECTLTLTNGTKTITKTSDIQASASSSTCKGFDVDIDSELSTGTWHIKLLVTIGNITGQAEQDKVLN